MPKAASKRGSTAPSSKPAKRPGAATTVAARKRLAVKKAPAKATPKKVAPKKAAPKKAAPKKVAPKKVAPKKVAPKKVAPKKAAPKKAAPKKVAAKKVAPKKVAPKKVAPKQAAPKKAAVKPSAKKAAAAIAKAITSTAAAGKRATAAATPPAAAKHAPAAGKRAAHRPSSGARRPLAMRQSARTAPAQSAPLPTPRKRLVKVGTFEQLISPFPMQVQTLCMALRELVGRALPQARETIFPAVRVAIFEAQGPIGFIEPRRDHARLYFTRGVELADQDKLLQSGGKPFPYVKLWHLDTLQAPALRALLQSAEALNRAKPVSTS
jgi:hypothetical protein